MPNKNPLFSQCIKHFQMTKINTVFRQSPKDKAKIEQMAKFFNITPSKLIRILTTGEDPDKDLVERVRIHHTVNELNRMALPLEGAISAVHDEKLMYSIGKLCAYTSAIMTCKYLGREAEAQKLETERAAVEADLYRAYGSAMNKHQA